jgi:hypothetical protein
VCSEAARQPDSRVTFVDSLSKSADKHRLFLDSPNRTTLAFDSDVLFVASPLSRG